MNKVRAAVVLLALSSSGLVGGGAAIAGVPEKADPPVCATYWTEYKVAIFLDNGFASEWLEKAKAKGCTRPKVKIPRVIGLTFDEVKPVLQGAGLRVASREKLFVDDTVPGTIGKQSPRGGTRVAIGKTVMLTVAR